MTMAEAPHVVVVGGGFGGLFATKALGRLGVKVTLVDRKNHHTFQPLLYQVATAALSPAEIAVPIRRVLRRQKNARVILANADAIDVSGRKVVFADGTSLDYDFAIVATGATHSYLGHGEWARAAPGLKTIEDALEIRKRVLYAYEAAEREDDREKRRAWMTFVVVGAGPTGVELAGALSEIARHALARDFRRIDPSQARVFLVEGSDEILPTYVPTLAKRARRQLVASEVEVMSGARVTGIDDEGVWIGGERILSRTVLWAAGIEGSPLGRSLGVPLDKAGRVLVDADLSLPGHPEVFVIGDLAAVRHAGGWVPGVAGAAIQAGRHAARCIAATLAGRSRPPFVYAHRGSLATIGRAAAVADFGRVRLSGFGAWLLWLAIHILLLVGFKNRLLVLLQWAWSYVSYDRGSRLITGELSTTAAAPPAVVRSSDASANKESRAGTAPP